MTSNLHIIARRIMKEHGFRVDFPPEAAAQAEQAESPSFQGPETDLTHLFWSSIDNDDSRDLDQIEYLQTEANGMRLYVAIANVDHFVPADSPLDKTAQQNTTSIYTGVETFPMLPLRLSTDLSSLLEGKKRLAVVTEMSVDPAGAVTQSTVYPAVVQNKAQLTYDAVAAWLEGKTEEASSDITKLMLDKIRRESELQDQLRRQDQLAQIMETRRHENGALTFGMTELRPSISPTGEVRLNVHRSNRATQLIENFMIVANQTSAAFLKGKNLPCIKRIVRTPKRWDKIVEVAKERGFTLPAQPEAKSLQQFLKDQQRKDPEQFPDLSLTVVKLLGRGEYIVEQPEQKPVGHFGLAVENYSHSTAPNRRYPDVLTQRLLLSAGAPAAAKIPAPGGSLEMLARQCTEKEDEANKVERSVHKSVAAVALSHRIGEEFPGTITGSSDKGVWVRIANPPVEGKLQGKARLLDVGDKVRVRLASTNPDRGFIDFDLIDP